MSSTVLADQPRPTSFSFDVPLDGITPEQMATVLAHAGATAPTKIRALTAAHQSGVVVTVTADQNGRYDPDHPVFHIRRDHPTGEVMVMAENALGRAGITYRRYGTRFAVTGVEAEMNAAEVLIWVAEQTGQAK